MAEKWLVLWLEICGLRWSLEEFNGDDEELMSDPRIVRVRFDSIAYVISYVSQLRAYV